MVSRIMCYHVSKFQLQSSIFLKSRFAAFFPELFVRPGRRNSYYALPSPLRALRSSVCSVFARRRSLSDRRCPLLTFPFFPFPSRPFCTMATQEQKQCSANKERAIICVWNWKVSESSGGTDLVSELLSTVKSSTNHVKYSFDAVTACVVDRWGGKTTVILTGENAMRAAIRLVSLPSHSAFHPWSNISEHNRDWICPRISCLDCKPNIGAAATCQNCGGARPDNLRHSLQIWEEQTDDLVTESGEHHDAEVGGDESETIDRRQPLKSTGHYSGPATKRTRVDAVHIGSNADVGGALAHPNADKEKSRLTVWGFVPTGDLVGSIQSLSASRAHFNGRVLLVDQYHSKRAVVVLSGRNAHRAALLLTNLPDGPNQQCPWHDISEHHREWYCPRMSCIEIEIDRPNIDTSGGKNRSAALCRGCGCARPKSLLEYSRIWERDVARGIEEDRASEQKLGKNLASDAAGRSGIVGVMARMASHSAAASTGSRGTASGDLPAVHVTSSTSASSSKTEFAAWSRAQAAAGMQNPVGDSLLSSSRFFLNHAKADLTCLLPSAPRRRIWAFDTNPNSGAKGWIWSDCVDTFVEVYLELDPTQRHAYEVVPPNVPCRMVYDLDMYIGGGINAGRDDEQMAAAISECK